MANPVEPARKQRANGVIVAACLAFVGGMIGMSYAAVPLYRLYCQLTGDQGTTQRVEQASKVILDRTIKIRFDSNVSGGLPWQFVPDNREITVKIGETVKAFYRVKNMSRRWFPGPISTRSSVSVSPKQSWNRGRNWKCRWFSMLIRIW
jgi:cytochrome c oxidase assembly protein subunit 11